MDSIRRCSHLGSHPFDLFPFSSYQKKEQPNRCLCREQSIMVGEGSFLYVALKNKLRSALPHCTEVPRASPCGQARPTHIGLGFTYNSTQCLFQRVHSTALSFKGFLLSPGIYSCPELYLIYFTPLSKQAFFTDSEWPLIRGFPRSLTTGLSFHLTLFARRWGC